MRNSRLPDRKRFRRCRRSRKRRVEQLLKILGRLSKTHEKIGDISPISYFFEQLDDPCPRNEARDPLGPAPPGIVAIVADVDLVNVRKFPSPLFPEYTCAGRGRDRD